MLNVSSTKIKSKAKFWPIKYIQDSRSKKNNELSDEVLVTFINMTEVKLEITKSDLGRLTPIVCEGLCIAFVLLCSAVCPV